VSEIQPVSERAQNRQTAESMAARQRDISISEFFSKTGTFWASTIRRKRS